MRAPINPMPIEDLADRKTVSSKCIARDSKIKVTLTTGLNRPPLMRKNVHAVTGNENAAPNAIYSSSEGVTDETEVSMLPFLVLLDEMKATWAAENAMKMKTVVPRNSPIPATT